MTADRRDPTNPFAPTEYPGWMDKTPDNRRAALVEKVAKPIYEDLLASRGGPHTKYLCDWLDYKSRKYATDAIDRIRAEVLEEAAKAVEAEIDEAYTMEDRAKNAARRYAAAAIRALKGDSNDV